MKYLKIADTDLNASAISLGCMRISKLEIPELETLVRKAIDFGINFFDHADIYGGGKSETMFGEVLKKNPKLRKQIILQSKCGICRGYYDNSKEHILKSVDGILQRLNTDYLDVLLLHRPDALMDPVEIKEAFDILEASKKVRYFGVSNMNENQMELLQRNLNQKLIINQLQFSIVHAIMVEEGINVNMYNDESLHHGGSIVDYARLHKITIQAWSALQASWEEGTFLNHPNYSLLNSVLQDLSEKYQLTPSAIAISWILRHPAQMQAIVGTTSLKHLEEICAGTKITITRKEWYDIYQTSDRKLP